MYQGVVSIENVTVVDISSFDELKSIIARGSVQRHTAGTQLNDESSRSHLILSIIIESTDLQTQSHGRGKVCHLSWYRYMYFVCTGMVCDEYDIRSPTFLPVLMWVIS